MKKILAIAALIATIILGGHSKYFAQSGLIKRTTTKSDRFDFSAGGTVAITGSPNGSIRVKASSRNEIEIAAEIEVQAASEADLAAFASMTGFVTQETLGRVGIVSVGLDNRQNGKKVDKKTIRKFAGLPYRIDYTIYVPRYCDLEITGGKGPITVEGVEGTFRINAVESDVILGLIGGGLNAVVGKGNVRVTMPDRSWRGGTIDIQVASGTLTLALPSALSADLDATILRTGKIENEISGLKPRSRNVPFTERSIAAKAGNGGVTMKFTVGDGTLRLSRIGKVE